MRHDENDLLDLIMDLVEAKTDRQLAAALEQSPSQISKFRHYELAIGAGLIVRINEITNLQISFIKSYITHGKHKPKVSK